MHNSDLYNTLLTLSRNLYFYNKIKLKDTFETRIYLMFMHFSVILIICKKKYVNFPQITYVSLFFCIENNLRELGFGDVSVNKKMKEFNKILYDILLKLDLDKDNSNSFKINHNLISKYFNELNDPKSTKFIEFKTYFNGFFYFCFELPIDNMIREAINYKK